MLDPKHWHPKYRPVSLNIAVIAGLSLIGWRLICGTPESVIVDVLWYIGLSLLEFTAAIIAFRVIKRGESLTFPYHILKKPSTSATFLLYLFLPKDDRETLPGDLDEEFATVILPKFGPFRAWLWYWVQTLSAVAYRNALCRWLLVGGGILKVGEWVTQRLRG